MTNLLLTFAIFIVPAAICWIITYREIGPGSSLARRPLLKDQSLFIGVAGFSAFPLINIAIAAALLVKIIERYEFERSAD